MSEFLNWPDGDGIWMANIPEIGWFPLRVKALVDDLPSAEQLHAEAVSPETAPPRRILAYVAQFPESETSWPYLFPGNHPAKEWRRPSMDEMAKADRFYGVSKEEKKQ